MGVRRAGRLVCVGAASAVLVWLAEGQAHARAFNLTLEYVAPSACPSAADFRAIVAGRLGYDPFLADMPDRVLVSVVSRGQMIEGRL